MADIADRPVSPLYEAIRDIMAGTWPEDEYDVADSPLGHADFKSQVSLTGEVEVSPIVRNSTSTGGATDTDFESLKSDDESESEWEAEAEGDDTMSTDIDVELKNNSAAAVERRRSIAEDGTGADIAARIDEVLEDEAKIRPRRNTIADEFAEGFRLEIAEELNNLVQEEPELEAAAAAATTTGGNTGYNADILPPVPEADIAAAEHMALTANRPAPPVVAPESERHLPRLTIPSPPAPAAPIQEQQQTPPPIPSRSPSRPNTALANYSIFPAPSASTASLHPLKPTVSALSSSRGSRFFEDLDTAAATSMEETSSTQRLGSGVRYEELKAATPPVDSVKLKKRRASFSCGLRLWGKGKEKKPAASGNDNARPASGRTSLGEKR
ncbi:uncharacterized protein LAJ45_05080 [Morchella importuna]|uniref:Uncharacterized protein n=1 Tax=Morchella conica CCBAS932 TaxID=1392247 RepID=A0A3N4L7W7_9PEZI|nr:uncharacterized protein LAJ45_05080 [Morchella importuna]KAH8150898.1 hypothetical protein LAJ45_05080 [Morchella importuna]RPB14095.1 hypothetical protein P167DRAFT_534320 [Morchella conica CCBAS932]